MTHYFYPLVFDHLCPICDYIINMEVGLNFRDCKSYSDRQGAQTNIDRYIIYAFLFDTNYQLQYNSVQPNDDTSI